MEYKWSSDFIQKFIIKKRDNSLTKSKAMQGATQPNFNIYPVARFIKTIAHIAVSE